jgi:hypothetical protein
MQDTVGQTFTSEIQKRIDAGEISETRVAAYRQLVERINKEILPHEVIVKNEFTAWFKEGQVDEEDVRHFLVQFSVFSNLFIEAQLRKVNNAPTLEAMHASKEILLNELGVIFKSKTGASGEDVTDGEIDAELIEAEGSIEGGTFRFGAAHFEWLLRMVKHLGLGFKDCGKRRHGTESTLFFCDELYRIYGSEDPTTGLGASFSVENWAAAGFWKELIQGLTIFKKRDCPKLPLGFFKWHDLIEDQHAQHTWDELQEDYFSEDAVDEDKFIQGGIEMLDGVMRFWTGLNQDRLAREGERKIPVQ